MPHSKKKFLNTCNFRSTLAYLSFKCGVVVELVTTLACHAGGRGFKSPPSRHFIFVLLLALSIAFHLESYADILEKKKTYLSPNAKNPVVIIAKNHPIYSFTDASKDLLHFYSNNASQFQGTDFEIIQQVFDSLRINYKIEIVPNEDLLLRLEKGTADIALGVDKTGGKEEFATFPKIPMRSYNYIFFGRKKEATSGVMSYASVRQHNYKVGITLGTVYPKSFWNAFPFENNVLNSLLDEVPANMDNIVRLNNKKIDLFVGNKDVVNALLKKEGLEDTIIQYKNVLFWKDFYCAFSKKSKQKNIDDIRKKVEKELYQLEQRNVLKTKDIFWLEKNI